MRGDGDGWVHTGDGQRRWGRHGAAGLLLRAPGPDGGPDPLVLLQHRVQWSHHGGTWGIPGGARDSGETAEQAAVREAVEETSIDPCRVRVRGEHRDDLGGDASGWTYTTVVADTDAPLATVPERESLELRWVPETKLDALPLHPGLAAAWPGLRAAPVRLVVDTANVVGAVPDGWWRDRAGASTRLLTALAAAVPRTVALPGGGFARLTGVTAVLEGAARAAHDVPGVDVVRAAGSGDDALVERIASGVPPRGSGAGPAGRVLVATADRGLRARLPDGVVVVSPTAVRSWADGTDGADGADGTDGTDGTDG